MFLISFLLPVSQCRALAVSIATTDGGPNFKARWEWMGVGGVGSRVRGCVEVQGQVGAALK